MNARKTLASEWQISQGAGRGEDGAVEKMHECIRCDGSSTRPSWGVEGVGVNSALHVLAKGPSPLNGQCMIWTELFIKDFHYPGEVPKKNVRPENNSTAKNRKTNPLDHITIKICI